MPRLYLVVNEDRFFLSHRLPVALAARERGYEVSVVCKDTGRAAEIVAQGLRFVPLPINPTGMKPWEEWRTLRFLRRLYQRERPDIVHHVGLKNILWGSIAAKWAQVPAVVNAFCGLGVLFSRERLSKQARGIMAMMRYAFRRPGCVAIFQNDEDRSLFVRTGVVAEEHCEYIKGSGVDLRLYQPTEEPSGGPVRILFTARMVEEKGVLVLCEAAERLRGEMEGKVEFLLCGGLSANPKALSQAELEARQDGSYIRWLGFRDDVRQLLSQSHIMAFPSYYREGLPLSLIEAAAAGRPVVTTRSVGCQDAVDDGVTGILVPPRDSEALAEALRQLINDKSMRQRMGKAARQKAEREFSLDEVVARHLSIYDRLLQA